MASGTLTLVATPIGNLDDISVRALRTLRESSFIVAEDSRVTRPLLRHFAIETELLSFRPRRDSNITQYILARLCAGESAAFVSDAGSPGIADPGVSLVSAALNAGIPVTTVPGPVAALAALTLSGFPSGRFVFEGFPPRSRADRYAFFKRLAQESRTILLYESRSHLRTTLASLADALGPERPILLARDLTKPTEDLFYGTLAQIIAQSTLVTQPHGEYALVLAGKADLPS